MTEISLYLLIIILNVNGSSDWKSKKQGCKMDKNTGKTIYDYRLALNLKPQWVESGEN